MPHLNRKAVRATKVPSTHSQEDLPALPSVRVLAVSFSNQHIYAQLIDDDAQKTIASACTTDKAVNKKGANVDTATEIGKLIASRAKDKKVETVVFDRGGFLFHGKVKALADAAREGGLKF